MSGRVEHLADGVVLHLGDCRDVLPTLPKVNCVAMDPPYGISYVTNHRRIMDTPAELANDASAPLWCVALSAARLLDGGGHVYLHP